MGINLATPHANWKERHEIATAIGKNTFFLVRKHLLLAEEVYGICQKNILRLCTVCTG